MSSLILHLIFYKVREIKFSCPPELLAPLRGSLQIPPSSWLNRRQPPHENERPQAVTSRVQRFRRSSLRPPQREEPSVKGSQSQNRRPRYLHLPRHHGGGARTLNRSCQILGKFRPKCMRSFTLTLPRSSTNQMDEPPKPSSSSHPSKRRSSKTKKSLQGIIFPFWRDSRANPQKKLQRPHRPLRRVGRRNDLPNERWKSP